MRIGMHVFLVVVCWLLWSLRFVLSFFFLPFSSFCALVHRTAGHESVITRCLFLFRLRYDRWWVVFARSVVGLANKRLGEQLVNDSVCRFGGQGGNYTMEWTVKFFCDVLLAKPLPWPRVIVHTPRSCWGFALNSSAHFEPLETNVIVAVRARVRTADGFGSVWVWMNIVQLVPKLVYTSEIQVLLWWKINSC